MKTDKKEPLILTLKDLYDDFVVYNARTSYEDNPWLKSEEDQSNFLTARELIVSKMPMIIHEACLTNRISELLKIVGESLPEHIYRFKDQQTYEEALKEILNDDKKVFFQYIHDKNQFNDNDYVVNRERFKELNDKSKIPKWTGGSFLPKREIVHVDEFDEKIKDWELPFVLKPADDRPTAGGYGVMICYEESDLQKAKERINEADDTNEIIIEQLIEEVNNYCVQYAYNEKNGIQYLGAVQQLTDKYGFYLGNINVKNVPQKVIDAGYKIMENGVEHGYKGIAGFDILVDKHEDVFAIDLNFRQNGSTSMLLLKNRLTDGSHKFLSYHSKGDNTYFFNVIKKYVEQGNLYPLSLYDGDYFGKDKVKSRFAGIWHAETEEKLNEIESNFLKELDGKV